MRYLSNIYHTLFFAILQPLRYGNNKKKVPGGFSGYIILGLEQKISQRGENMRKEEKRDEKKPITWEMADPKPPVIQSGHLENRRAN